MRRLTLVLGFAVGILLLGAAGSIAQPFAAQIQIAINQLVTGVTPFTALRNVASAYMNFGATGGVNGYGFRDNAGVIEAKNSGGAWLPLPTSSTLPTAASFITRVAEANLSNETALGTLASGLLLNTTVTGTPTIYAGTTCTNQFVRVLSAAGVATCATVDILTDTTSTLTVARGGTGLTAGTSGGILAFTAAGTLATSAALTANALVLGGGAGVVPATMASLGTTTTLLHGNAAGAPTFGAVTLTTDVTGILPTANGGTASAFFTVAGPTAARIFTFPNAAATILTSAAAVTPAQGGTGLVTYAIGDLITATGATTLAALADAATGNALISGGVGVIPAYGKIGLTTHIVGTLGATNGGTGLAAYTTGDLLYASSGTTLAARAAVATGQVFASAGAATAPVWTATPTVTSISATTSYLSSGNMVYLMTVPTITSGFSTTPPSIAGKASAFAVTIAATPGVTGLVAFNGTFTNVPSVNCTNTITANIVQAVPTTTTVVLNGVWVSGDVIRCTAIGY